MKISPATVAAAFLVPAMLVVPAKAVARQSPPRTLAAHSSAPKACAAFTRWNRARPPANLNALLTPSESAPWELLGLDVIVLYTDWRNTDRWDAPDDIKDVAKVCAKL